MSSIPKWVFILVAIFPIGFGPACSPSRNTSEPAWAGTVGEENGVRLVENPADPVFGEITLELEENLRIGEEEDGPLFDQASNLQVDGDGSIFVMDRGAGRVFKFDRNGVLLKTIGRPGQGPGEFDNLSTIFTARDGSLYTVDGLRLQYFSAEGEFLKSVPLTARLSSLLVPAGDSLFGVEIRNTETGRSQVLIRIDSDGRAKEEIGQYSDVRVVDQRDEGRVMRVAVVHGYNARLLLAPISGGGFAYGFASDYSIHCCGADGTPGLLIKKTETPIPISQAEQDRVVFNLMQNVVVRTRNIREEVIRRGCEFPAYRPFFADILADDSGRIYVLRSRSVMDETAPRSLDVFDRKGYFIQRVNLPFSPAAIRRGLVYRIHEDEETGAVTVRRYSVSNWDRIRTSLHLSPSAKDSAEIPI